MKQRLRLAAGASPHRTAYPTIAGNSVGNGGYNGKKHTSARRKTAGNLALKSKAVINPEGQPTLGATGKVSGSKLFARSAGQNTNTRNNPEGSRRRGTHGKVTGFASSRRSPLSSSPSRFRS